ncbi:2OG-Fe(II) oxygenase [Legionella fairfieldensis]|uniref:2OG-Fe(II) oxygenase n=1 Tax=Legionella fairfieldensis TaxID=45064 RepID=UPI000687BE0B|nr:2OG-Fe(II) oxygenase [Legionella fairfieldensis]
MRKQIEDEIHRNGFYIVDNFLEQKDYQALRRFAQKKHNKGHYKQAKIGYQINASHNQTIRRDEICWLDQDSSGPSLSAYFAKTQALAEKLNQTLFLGLTDFEAHLSIYQPGAFYKKHIDQFALAKERCISCVYYLNENWQESFAGQLKIYDQKEELIVSVLPQGNRFICFRSELLHEVCETKQTRYSIAGWMKIRPLSG